MVSTVSSHKAEIKLEVILWCDEGWYITVQPKLCHIVNATLMFIVLQNESEIALPLKVLILAISSQ